MLHHMFVAIDFYDNDFHDICQVIMYAVQLSYSFETVVSVNIAYEAPVMNTYTMCTQKEYTLRLA